MSRFSTSLIHAQELLPYARWLQAAGANSGRLFERSEIPLEAVWNDKAMITMFQAYDFIERGACHIGNEILGSAVGEEMHLSDLGPLGLEIIRSTTLLEASEGLMTAMQATEQGSQCWIQSKTDEAWLCYRPEIRFEVGAIQAEQFDLQYLLKILRLAGGDSWLPRKVRVSAIPSKTLGKVPEFSQAQVQRHPDTTAIAFPASLLAKSLGNSPTTGNAPKEHKFDSGVIAKNGLSTAIHKLLRSPGMDRFIPMLESVADRFGVGVRTLQRALTEEGTSYSRITKRVRFDQASELLINTDLSLKEIAFELGYTSLNSFVRSFREMSGITPKSFRKQNTCTE